MMNYNSKVPWRLAFICLCVFLLVQAGSYAGQVTSENAVTAVKGWLKTDRAPLGEVLGRPAAQPDAFKDKSGTVAFYVVNLEPTGFVIVPADDTVEPVIAFSATGRFDPTSKAPLSTIVTREVPQRVARARAVTKSGADSRLLKSQAKWQRLERAGTSVAALAAATQSLPDVRVAPFLKSEWDQATEESGLACYNFYTPPYGAGNAANYPCGCVATAMAQLMRYYRYPTAGVGTAGFTITVNNVSKAAQLRGGDGAGGSYNWNNMPLSPSGASLAQRQAIGALTYDAGVAVSMQYASIDDGGSAAYYQDAATALTSVFKYSRAIYGQNNNPTDGAGLNSMINPNLDARYPVLLGIDDSQGGHAIVCDGYGYSVSTLYHHLNMGWSGSDDAWYALPIIDTSDTTFTSLFDCIYNVYVSGTGEIVSGRVTETSGTPIAGVTVTAARQQGGTYTATTDTNGIFAVTKIPSDSQYLVTVGKAGYYGSGSSFSTGKSRNGEVVSGNVWGADFVLVRMGPPSILEQSTNQTISAGASARFEVQAVGSSPITYQWQRNGASIPGATNSSYVLNSAEVSDSGAQFACFIQNPMGSMTSAAVTLTVMPPVVDHFAWSTIPSPQSTDYPIAVTVQAEDALNTPLSNFTGTVAFSATGWDGSALFSDGFESGKMTGWTSEGGTYSKSVVSTTAAQGSWSVTLNGSSTNSYDGIQHTFSALRPDRVNFSIRGSTTNAAGGYFVIGAAKYRTNSIAHFRLNNDGTMGLTDGDLQWHGVPYEAGHWYKISLLIDWNQRAVDYYVNDTLAASKVSFCNSNITSISVVNLFNVENTQAWWDQIEFLSTSGSTPVSISPTVSGQFVNGVWSGAISVSTPATNVVLQADDGAGHSGLSAPFAVYGQNSIAPIITTQPKDQRAPIGSTATFSVAAAAPPPLSYRWLRDGTPIAGATDSAYSLANVQWTDSHSQFTCEIQNSAGLITSRSAALVVSSTNHVRVAIFGAATEEENDDIKAKLVDTGLFDASDVDVFSIIDLPMPDISALRRYAAILTYSWWDYPDSAEFGDTLADYVDQGGGVVMGFDCFNTDTGYGIGGRLVSEGYSPLVRGAATYSPPDMRLLKDLPDHPLLTGVSDIDSGSRSYHDKAKLASGATLAARWSDLTPLAAFKETAGRVVGLNFYPPSSDVETSSWIASGDAKRLIANALLWAGKNGTNIAPSIVTQPRSQMTTEGGAVSFSVTAMGSAPLIYQWRAGTNLLSDFDKIQGATTSTLVLSQISPSDATNYNVVVSNPVGSVTSADATLSLLLPPTIITQPSNQTVIAGVKTSFTAATTGTDPMWWQWMKGTTPLKNGGNISGATSKVLTILSPAAGDAGVYSVVASNIFGGTTSLPANLTVITRPSIVVQPRSRTNIVHTSATFTVTANGGGLGYQWKLGGVPISDSSNVSGSQSDTLTFAAVEPEDMGSYSVAISNSAGRVESVVAKLFVAAPPAVSQAPTNQITAFNSNVVFRILATGTAPFSYSWFHGSSKLSNRAGKFSRATTSNLTVSAVGAADAGSYFVVVSNAYGIATSTPALLRLKPTVAIITPKAGAVLSNSTCSVVGTATDAGGPGIAQVLWQLNGGAFQSASLSSNWVAAVEMQSGTNVLAVKSVDLDGLESPLASRTYVFNPFLKRQGVYDGLFHETDTIRHARSGFLTFTLSGSGTYSGRIYVGGASRSISGKFDMSGHSHLISTSPSRLTIDAVLDLEDQDGSVTGQIAGTNWSAQLLGYRALYKSSQAASYNLALLGTGDGMAAPGGDGIGMLTIKTNGLVVLTGSVSDGAALALPTTYLNRNGDLPFYSVLYSGKGSVIGWLTNQDGAFNGALTWTKAGAFGTNYVSGFTNILTAESDVWRAATSAHALSLTNAIAILDGDGFAAPITNEVQVLSNSSIVVSPGQTNGLALSLNASNGQITGSFIHPVTRQKTQIKGIVLPSQNEARGYFAAPHPGSFLLKQKQ